MNNLVEVVKHAFEGQVNLHERRKGIWQLILPVFHEDGDMIDIYVRVSPDSGNLIRITDLGLSLMRLSYNFEINTPPREKIFETLLIQNAVMEHEGELYLDSAPELLFQSVMQFVGLVQKVCNMRLWQRDTVKSLFYEDLEVFVFDKLSMFQPRQNVVPLPDYPVLEVDYVLEAKNKPFFLYGVGSQDRAKTAAIALLEFQKASLAFMGVIVYESMESMPKKAATYLTKNADKQFTSLDDFRSSGVQTLSRLAA
ncbi:MAG: hypothetical protein CO186_10310 [Zetaproteobacteria bacterium CG_4_9_14_3_um_filter_49_83]|nr:MAG: hypothetical protein COW62_11155 [Zetaproteobacteria bacterium CG17_big_fil_post_rev_8_21_14_2_50_50_13]PIV29263.1 MAG: hypothetical protein COS35_13060 [Zetaproteobacteria bacterium CG02_land_8_20_14_3_00_50_9]PIY56098.1 MAG: hypothetical protein COZ00_06070 [Zetaproteobacteria bacterium CG_4_10_14_0_8_um_filter_49_80]PJA34538.1 MAG: hypothetical protein CO186_10310 [Zetaproteobacteria bacterium CG_4_9_14_3_um_filter_49_83]